MARNAEPPLGTPRHREGFRGRMWWLSGPAASGLAQNSAHPFRLVRGHQALHQVISEGVAVLLAGHVQEPAEGQVAPLMGGRPKLLRGLPHTPVILQIPGCDRQPGLSQAGPQPPDRLRVKGFPEPVRKPASNRSRLNADKLLPRPASWTSRSSRTRCRASPWTVALFRSVAGLRPTRAAPC